MTAQEDAVKVQLTYQLLLLVLLWLVLIPTHAEEPDWQASSRRLMEVQRQGDYRQLENIAKAISSKVTDAHARDANAVSALFVAGMALTEIGAVDVAELALRRAMTMSQTLSGNLSEQTLRIQVALALAMRRSTRGDEAEQLLLSAIKLSEQEGFLGPLSLALVGLGDIYTVRGRLHEAESTLRRSIRLTEDGRAVKDQTYAHALTLLGYCLILKGEYGDGERLLRQSVTEFERLSGSSHPNLSQPLFFLQMVYVARRRYFEAAAIGMRLIDLLSKAYGPEHPVLAIPISSQADMQFRVGNLQAAEANYTRALSISEKAFGSEHYANAFALMGLGKIFRVRRQLSEAGHLYRRSLTIIENAVGKSATAVILPLYELATIDALNGRYAQAADYLRRAVDISRKAMGPSPFTAATIAALARVLWEANDLDAALSLAREATAILIRQRGDTAFGGGVHERLGRELEPSRVFELHIDLLARQYETSPNPLGVANEAFEIAQHALVDATAGQLDRMAARFAVGDDELARLSQRTQFIATRARSVDQMLQRALSMPQQQRNVQFEARLREDAELILSAKHELENTIRTKFPRYGELATFHPTSVAEIQALLFEGEAMLVIKSGVQRTYLWLVKKANVQFHALPVPQSKLTDLVMQLRRQLDPRLVLSGQQSVTEFDTTAAYGLYANLIAPFQSALIDVRHLIFVPDKALQSIPLGVLVSSASGKTKLSELRSLPWLVKQYALSVMPSPSSLRALRKYASPPKADLAFIGIGDPILSEEQDATNAVSSDVFFARGPIADVTEVKKLQSLPETLDELKAMGSTIGGRGVFVFNRADATETRIKSADLSRFQVIAFATHGLVAGEFKGLAEPALVLTPPSTASPLDDGLLTASEIALLKLDADWVILSACNSAAPDGTPGASGLSGLAKAFFYAGARSLLVSHWIVDSAASLAITGNLFREYKKGASKASSLQSSMMALMQDEERPYWAHPMFWAPFIVVGEGASRRVAQ